MASSEEKKIQKPICGVVMPISLIDGCNEAHWLEIRAIIYQGVELAGFEPRLVSEAEDVGTIHKRIIQNLYDDPILVCDVSAKNANVMFELGMRLAFDKPTIIVKDDKTSYSFDTAQIEHLQYPRDLRFTRIVEFKSKLAEKIKATYDRSTKDDGFTTFLKHFGEFKVAKLDKKEVPGQEYILEELRNIRADITRLQSSRFRLSTSPTETVPGGRRGGVRIASQIEVDCPSNPEKTKELMMTLESLPGVLCVKLHESESESECPKIIIQTERRAAVEAILDRWSANSSVNKATFNLDGCRPKTI
jgi:hypothetical protein